MLGDPAVYLRCRHQMTRDKRLRVSDVEDQRGTSRQAAENCLDEAHHRPTVPSLVTLEARKP